MGEGARPGEADQADHTGEAAHEAGRDRPEEAAAPHPVVGDKARLIGLKSRRRHLARDIIAPAAPSTGN